LKNEYFVPAIKKAGAASRKASLAQPLRDGPDYGQRPEVIEERQEWQAGQHAVNPYLNTPPTKLKRDILKETDPAKKRLMQEALSAWRITVPGPFWRTATAKVLLRLARKLLASAPLTKPYLQKIVRKVESDPYTFVPNGAEIAKKWMQPSRLELELTADDLWKAMRREGVSEDEIRELQKIPQPRQRRKPTKQTKQFDLVDFGKAVGASVATQGDVWDMGKEAGLVEKGIGQLRRTKAGRLWSQVNKIVLTPDVRPAARWDAGGVLRIGLKGKTKASDWKHTIAHELGHALESKSGLTVTAWDDTPYGKPPYPSPYGEMNPSEDFAEAFRMFVMEPGVLKRVAPSKYADMKARM